MPDFLSLYAQAMPDKLAVVDDRPDGTILRWTFGELEARANQLGHVLIELGAGPGPQGRLVRPELAGHRRPS